MYGEFALYHGIIEGRFGDQQNLKHGISIHDISRFQPFKENE